MADNFTINFDDQAISEFLEKAPRVLGPASAAAINRSLTSGRALMAKIARRDYNIRSGEVRGLAKITRANARAGNPMGSISFSSRPLSLDRFSKGRRQTAAGIKINVKRANTHTLKKAFRLPGIKGQLFQRQGGKIRARKTTAIASLLNSNRVEFTKQVTDTLEKRLGAEIERRLGRSGLAAN